MRLRFIIGTRGSKLALIQSEIVKKLLKKIAPEISIEIKEITTTGDVNMKPVPLDSVGKGWFTKEIDKALLSGKIDIAVHSLKDVPEVLPKGLMIAAIPKREDAREALVTKNHVLFKKLPKGAMIGTDSSRRKTQILAMRPDLVVESIRGNVQTRLTKLDAGLYDGILLAVAGLKRLKLLRRVSQYFSESELVPSPGQGALAVVVREKDTELREFLKKISHDNTLIAIAAERAFSHTVGGGCKLPVGMHVSCFQNEVVMHGMIGSLDGAHMVKKSLRGKSVDALPLAKKLALQLLRASKSWYHHSISSVSLKEKQYVILTRPNEDKQIRKEIASLGLIPYEYPSIVIGPRRFTKEVRKILSNYTSFDTIVFTSHNGVRYFFDALKKLHISPDKLKTMSFAAVGPKTAEALKEHHLSVSFVPSVFTTEQLAKELPDVVGKKILLPRSDIASSQLVQLLRKRGAYVINVPIYSTKRSAIKNKTVARLFREGRVKTIFFTSPSTVNGFLDNIENMKAASLVFTLPVMAIGPVTAQTLTDAGFHHIDVADRFTTGDMVKKLIQQSIY